MQVWRCQPVLRESDPPALDAVTRPLARYRLQLRDALLLVEQIAGLRTETQRATVTEIPNNRKTLHFRVNLR